MANLSVLPSQKGKLSSEPNWNRKFGIELEFDPDGETMLAYRLALYRHGIDTLDDSCPRLNRRRGEGNDPARFYKDLSCRSEDCRGRGNHLVDLFGFANDELILAFPPNAESVLQSCNPEWEGKSLLYIITNARSYPDAYTTGLLKLFPRIKDPLRRHWNLGTDPSAGYELRTIPLYGKDGWKALEDACTALKEVGGNATQACGGHVHQDMTDEDGRSTARILAVYRMVEPLLAAVVDPTRYYDGSYNKPSWFLDTYRPPDGQGLKRIGGNKNHASNFSTRWMNSEAIMHHGSFEFRGLEGTLEPTTFRNWSLLLNRFIEASRQGEWGVQMKHVVPLQVDTTSIRAFFKFLDITRSDVSTELKEVRDWYLERIREFSERDAFQQSLVVPGNKLFADLKTLRTTGRFQKVEVFKAAVNNTIKKSSKEHGMFLYQVFERYVAGVRPAEGQRVQGDIYDTFRNAYVRMGLHEPDNIRNWGEGSRDVEWFGWLVRTGDGNNCQLLEEFWKYIRTYDFQLLSMWYEANVLDSRGDPIPARMEGLGMVLEEWAQSWGREWPSHKSLIEALTSGDISCVDF